MHSSLTKVALLQELARGPACGLTLISLIARCTRDEIKLKQGGVYPALHALEQEKLIEIASVNTVASGRPRRVCSLTPLGRRRVQRDRETLKRLCGKG